MSRETALAPESLREAYLEAERKTKEVNARIGRAIVAAVRLVGVQGLGSDLRVVPMCGGLLDLIALSERCKADEQLAWDAYAGLAREGEES